MILLNRYALIAGPACDKQSSYQYTLSVCLQTITQNTS